MNPTRLEKINELLTREIGSIIQREFEHGHDLFITVTEVKTSEDLLHAEVHVSIWPDKARAETFQNLKNAAGFFQSILNKRLRMHPVPRILFRLDPRIRDAARIEELLDTMENKEE